VPALQAAVTASIEHLRPWMPWAADEPVSLAQRRALVRRWRRVWLEGGDTIMGIFDGDEVVGGTGLHRRPGPGGLEIGYWIHVERTGRGYATRAARLLTTAAFTVPGINFVEIHHDAANQRSGAVPRRLGYTYVGATPDAVTAPGEQGLDCRWRVTRDDWGRLSA
jgi:RimJ/RimL family protein N-acetyltransferase